MLGLGWLTYSSVVETDAGTGHWRSEEIDEDYIVAGDRSAVLRLLSWLLLLRRSLSHRLGAVIDF